MTAVDIEMPGHAVTIHCTIDGLAIDCECGTYLDTEDTWQIGLDQIIGLYRSHLTDNASAPQPAPPPPSDRLDMTGWDPAAAAAFTAAMTHLDDPES